LEKPQAIAKKVLKNGFINRWTPGAKDHLDEILRILDNEEWKSTFSPHI
jgi:hypothetical protein